MNRLSAVFGPWFDGRFLRSDVFNLLSVTKRRLFATAELYSKKGKRLSITVSESIIFFLIDLIYSPFRVLLRATMIFFYLTPSVLTVGLGSVQIYCIHYKKGILVLGASVGCDLKV